ncbi:MAG TPA: 30S ribosome-binding factor RbfA [Gammaproteobacteria bacterium]|nr:30S ribosome-binding factor RbfA [Gammaproteobacteria bacterium]
MKNSSRKGRLGDLLQREIATLVRDECKDPRLGMITISGVEVTDDLSFARVYVTVLEDEKRDASIEALNHAAGFFRTQLSKHLTLRVVPKIRFIYDSSLVNGSRMDMLLNSVKPPVDQDDSDQESA